MKKLVLLLAFFALAACTTSNTRTALSIERPKAGAKILVVKPDVKLALLTAAGLPEARADWTAAGTQNVQAAMEGHMKTLGHSFQAIDPSQSMGGREGQLLRLHEAVGTTILAYNYSGFTLPTKAKKFDWTLGDGARTLAETYGADYALFTYANGTYASGGRVVAMIGMAALGVSIPLGSQYVATSLVDLHTGRVVWFNQALAGPNDDMRQEDGSRTLVAALLKDAPL